MFIAPDSEQFVCPNAYGEPGLWYGSFRRGIIRRVADKPGYVAWFPDNKRIVHSEFVSLCYASPLYVLDLASGESIQIGFVSNERAFQVRSDGRAFFLEPNFWYGSL